jgi:hypothetical protein
MELIASSPQRRSFPVIAFILSSHSRAAKTSRPVVPGRSSLPEVPIIIAGSPSQVIIGFAITVNDAGVSAVLLAASVAVQSTSVLPIGNVEPIP